MAVPDIQFLIEKYLNRSISEDELDTLENLLKNRENVRIFKNLVKDDYLLKTKNKHYNPDVSLARVKQELEQTTTRKVIRFKPFYKYAAVASILLIVSLTIFLNKGEDTPQFAKPIIVNNQIETGLTKATLTLASGEEVVLIKGTSYQTQNASSNGEEITYKAVERNNTEIAYNYLTIPRGGQFQLTLTDGTQVWLNSGSQLKYPVVFTSGQTRQVELVYGEAYFDVSPSIEHNGADFKVYHREQEVQVLGTEFNIKAYKDEINIYTTLVEGKVAVNTKNQNKILAPTEQANLNKVLNTISISTVDVYNEISWKEGIFSFEGKSLKDLMQVLSRWYDMEVHFENKKLEDIKFLGKLKKSQSIEEILIAIKNSSIINNFEIRNKTIILK